MTFILFLFLIKNKLININIKKIKKNKLNLFKENFCWNFYNILFYMEPKNSCYWRCSIFPNI